MSIRKTLNNLKKADSCYYQMVKAGASRLHSIRHSFNRNHQQAFALFKKMPYSDTPVIMDIGANKGQFSELATIRYSPSKVICCEPLPKAFSELKHKFGTNSLFHLYCCALGSEEGTSKFEVNSHDQASSILPIQNSGELSFSHRDLSPDKKIEVNIDTLDNICKKSRTSQIDILKLDVQGYELEVLKGGLSILENVKSILTEVSFYPLYQNGVLFWEIHQFLLDRGFYLKDLRDYQLSGKNYVLQGDAIYINGKLDP